MALRAFLKRHGISQADLGRGIHKTTAFVSQLVNGKVGASLETVNAVLAWLSERCGRAVRYEEVFAAPASTAEHTDVGPDLAEATENAEPQGRGSTSRADAASIGAEEALRAAPSADEHAPAEGSPINRRRNHERRTGTEG